MKRIDSGRPKSIRLHNEMDIREGKTTIACELCKQRVHNYMWVVQKSIEHSMVLYFKMIIHN